MALLFFSPVDTTTSIAVMSSATGYQPRGHAWALKLASIEHKRHRDE
jgi:hypothetical protein